MKSILAGALGLLLASPPPEEGTDAGAAELRARDAALLEDDAEGPGEAGSPVATVEGPARQSGYLSDAAMAHFREAQRFRAMGNFRLAESELKRVESLFPEWTPVYFNLALMAQAQRDWADQVDYLERYQPYAAKGEQATVDALLVEARPKAQRRKELLDESGRARRIAGPMLIPTTLGIATGVAGVTLYLSSSVPTPGYLAMSGVGVAIGTAFMVTSALLYRKAKRLRGEAAAI